MGRLAREFRKGSDVYFLDRLVTAGIVEARGCERFGIVAAALPPGALQDFYRDIARSEVRHQEAYLDLARIYFDGDEVERRLEELLQVEARVIAELPVRAALY
jgi:tRNA-(ms[2]io[6]A)-hydroxylase